MIWKLIRKIIMIADPMDQMMKMTKMMIRMRKTKMMRMTITMTLQIVISCKWIKTLLFFADDNNFEESDDNNWEADNHFLQHTMIPGGPQKPDCSWMIVADAMTAMEKYKRECKPFTDPQIVSDWSIQRISLMQPLVYTGSFAKTLHLMLVNRLQLIW